MSTIAIVLIALGAVLVLALIYAGIKARRRRDLEARRGLAEEHRSAASDGRIEAEREAALADEQAAAARRQAAEAEARARAAHESRSQAEAHQTYAEEIDPDADGRDEPDTGERSARPSGREA